MKREKKIIYWIIYTLIYYGLVSQFLWKDNHILGYVPDILILYLTYYTFPKDSKVHYRKIISTSAIYIYCTFLIVGTISWIFERSSILSWLWGIRIYVRYAFLFFSMYNCLDYKDVIRIKEIFIKAFKINLLFVPVEYFMLGINHDAVGGTFSLGNSSLLFFCTYAIYFFLGDYFTTHKNIDWTYLSLYFGGLLFAAIVGEIRFMYFLMPIVVYLVYMVTRRFSINNVLIIVFIIVLLTPIYRYTMSFNYEEDYIDNTFDTEELQKYTTMEGGFGSKFNRNTVFEHSLKYLTTSTTSFYLGHGFGAGSTTDVKSLQSPFALKNMETGYQFFTVSYIIAETGFVGFVLAVLFHIVIFYRFGRYYFKYRRDPIISYWAGIGVISVPILILLAWYNCLPVYRGFFTVITWAMIAISIKSRLIEIHRN